MNSRAQVTNVTMKVQHATDSGSLPVPTRSPSPGGARRIKTYPRGISSIAHKRPIVHRDCSHWQSDGPCTQADSDSDPISDSDPGRYQVLEGSVTRTGGRSLRLALPQAAHATLCCLCRSSYQLSIRSDICDFKFGRNYGFNSAARVICDFDEDR